MKTRKHSSCYLMSFLVFLFVIFQSCVTGNVFASLKLGFVIAMAQRTSQVFIKQQKVESLNRVNVI